MNPQGDDRVSWSWGLFRKIIYWILAIILAVLILITLIGYIGPKIENWWYKYKFEKLVKETEKQVADYEKRLKEDVLGGKTPEEAVNLLIAALQDKNIDLAVKYYDVQTQEKARKSLEDIFNKKGNFESDIEYFLRLINQGKKTCDKNGCGFEYEYITDKDEYVYFDNNNPKVLIPKGSIQRNYIEFKKNSISNLWKIVEL